MKKPRKLEQIFDYLNFGKSEREIYAFLLSKGGGTITQIKDGLRLSEKTVRTQLQRLMDLGFIERKIVEDGRLKYVYFAENISTGWKNLKNKIQKIVGEVTS